jgi:hypothetical protein
VQQRINLYLKIERPERKLLDAQRMLLACVALFFLLMFGSGILWYSTLVKVDKVAQLQEQQQHLQLQVDQLLATRDKLSDPAPLQAKINQLNRQLAMKRAVYKALQKMPAPRQEGFSSYLSALARQHLDGLWFTVLEIQRGGSQVALTGKTREPKLVPHYLYMLGAESVFAGQQFDLFRISQPEKERWLHDFEIRSLGNDQELDGGREK